MNKPYPGTLIVIEGGDGSGKTTQSRLLDDYLSTHNIKHSVLDFPRYDTFFGALVAKFLRGELGPLQEVSPYLAALTFALDRNAAKSDLVKRLAEGEIIITNRYVTSNLAHQAARIQNETEREAFVTWCSELEYEVHDLPREDIVIYLKADALTTFELTGKKGDRTYLQGKHDIQEVDSNHRNASIMMYNILSQQYKHWSTIDCISGGSLRNPQEIHQDIVQILKNKGIVK